MKFRPVLVAVSLMLCARTVSADSITIVKGDASWHEFQTPSTGGTAFWNNSSFDDNHQCNVGYWLSGTGGCAPGGASFGATSPRMTPSYLGDASTGFSFTKAGNTHAVTVTTLLGVTAYRDVDEFGWFNASDPSALNPLFFGFGGGGSATFDPSESYGFYLRSPDGTYQSTGTGDSQTHFALFQLAGDGHYLLGVEDMWAGSDRDFNDLVIDVQVVPSPEPASMVLLGTGLAGIGAAVRRRRVR